MTNPELSATQHLQGWIRIQVPASIEQQARTIRKSRDAQYGNLFQTQPSDMRWVGEIGEICFNWWLSQTVGLDFQWIVDETAGKPDFTIESTPIGLKTVR